MVREEEEKSRWWWFESHKSSKHSQWLHSTLAETYYKKRPELITIVEDFYRAHRSLAERFDHLKSSSDHRSSKFHQQEEPMESVSEFEDAGSEIEDPDEDQKDSSPIPPPFQEEIKKTNCKEDETCKLEQERLKLIECINLRLKRHLQDESLKKRSSSSKLFYTMRQGKKIL